MADEHGVVLAGQGQLAHLGGQGINGGLAATDLGNVDEVTLVVHVKHRLDLQHGANQRRGGADPAAPLQIHQIVYGEPVAQLELVFLHPGVELFQSHAGFFLLAGVPHQQALAQGGAQGIHHQELPVGILFGKFGCRNDRGLIGGGKAGGEGQHQSVVTAGQHRLHDLGPAFGVRGGGGSGLAFTQTVVNGLEAVVGEVFKGLALKDHRQRTHGQAQVFIHVGGEVTAGIGNDPVAHNIFTLL